MEGSFAGETCCMVTRTLCALDGEGGAEVGDRVLVTRASGCEAPTNS